MIETNFFFGGGCNKDLILYLIEQIKNSCFQGQNKNHSPSYFSQVVILSYSFQHVVKNQSIVLFNGWAQTGVNKGIESLPQTQIFKSLYLWNQMSQTLDISNYEFCQIKFSEFEISKIFKKHEVLKIQGFEYRGLNI